MEYTGLILATVVIEGIISYAKLMVVNGRLQWQNVAAILLGVLISFGYQVDLFTIMGMSSKIPYLGVILTGILISRGSNYIYEIIRLLQGKVNSQRLVNEQDAASKK